MAQENIKREWKERGDVFRNVSSSSDLYVINRIYSVNTE